MDYDWIAEALMICLYVLLWSFPPFQVAIEGENKIAAIPLSNLK